MSQSKLMKMFCLHPEDVLTKIVRAFYAHLTSPRLFENNLLAQPQHPLRQHLPLQPAPLLIAYVKRRDVALKRFLQKNFTKPMSTFPDFSKELRAVIVKRVGEAQPTKTDHVPIDHTITKKETKEPKKETEKMELVNIATSGEKEEKANPKPAPPVDSTIVVPPPFIEPRTEQYHEINWIIDEITKPNDE
ncbi:hypothetical protein J1N35_010709 [Gossypium stocksii]|uniref:Uncharacterized protein n=1 Tax=Gossypium stocksii TaxID=47602 RepID=A0A9D3W0K0_9ROSI|nr:hypothetical protein J1N35_010709 [Gossypium stocksii]